MIENKNDIIYRLTNASVASSIREAHFAVAKVTFSSAQRGADITVGITGCEQCR